MIILVTGSTGFLGRWLVRALRKKNHTVISYDLSEGCDILNKNQLETYCKNYKPDCIIHLAACADLNIFREKPNLSYQVNVIGTRNILRLCERYNVRLLFASTCCCYGNNNEHPSDEISEIAPTEPYAQSKVESEIDIISVGLPHCCMRLATFYGPEMRSALAPAIFLDRAHHEKPIQIHGTGKQSRTFTYIDDIVSGIITIVETEPKYIVINVTTEEMTTVLALVEIAKKITGNNVRLQYVPDRYGQILKENIRSRRLQSLGWKPKTTFINGMKKSYQYYLDNGAIW